VAEKPFADYVERKPDWWESSLAEYTKSPAVAFLREAVHIADAMNQCQRRFQKKADGSYNKDSQDSIYRLSAAALGSIMGHFETFQRYLFAGMVEATRHIPGFDNIPGIRDICAGIAEGGPRTVPEDRFGSSTQALRVATRRSTRIRARNTHHTSVLSTGFAVMRMRRDSAAS
jgi:hypothetical protein